MSFYTRRKFLNTLPLAAAITTMPQVLNASSLKTTKEFKDGSFTILFQGDSITDGNRGRNNDPNHIMGHGYAFSIASRLGADYPDRNLKFINKGISGNTVQDLTNRWQQDALDLKPDVISILIGINDTAFALKNKDTQHDNFEATYRALLENTRANLPETLIILGEPFILPVGNVKENLASWLDEIKPRQQAVKKLADDFKAIFVGYQNVFTKACEKAAESYWIWDGIHPTVAGHELMAREWIRTTSQKLPIITNSYK